LAINGQEVFAVEPSAVKTDPKFVEKGFYTLNFVKGKNPKLLVTSPENDKKINLAERNDIRISFDPEELYINKYEKQGAVKVDLYETVEGKRKYVSSQTVTLGRARDRITMTMELGRFSKSSKDIEIDIYDTEKRLVNTYSANIKAEFLNAQSSISSIELNTNPKADCLAGSFDDCYIEHILDRISFEARAQQQISTRVLKSATGNYIVTVPVPREGFKSLRESKFKANVIGANGEITGGIDETFTEVTSPIVNIGDTASDYQRFIYDNTKKQLDLFTNGATTANLSVTDTGKIGIGVTDPSAYLDVRGGTGLIPQIRLRGGSLVSAPINGVIEYDGGDFYFTTNNVRKSLSGLSGSSSTAVNASQITGVLGQAQLPIKVVYTDTAQTVDSKTLTNTAFNGNIMVKNGATLKIGLNAGAGKVLTSNALGVATWQALPVSSVANGTNFGLDGQGTTLIGESTTIQGSTAFAPGAGAVNGDTGLTVTQTIMRLTGDGSALTDLVNVPQQIGPAAQDGQLLILKCVAPAGQRIKFYNNAKLDLVGNSFLILDAGDTLTLIYDALESKWVEVSRSLN